MPSSDSLRDRFNVLLIFPADFSSFQFPRWTVYLTELYPQCISTVMPQCGTVVLWLNYLQNHLFLLLSNFLFCGLDKMLSKVYENVLILDTFLAVHNELCDCFLVIVLDWLPFMLISFLLACIFKKSSLDCTIIFS